MKPYKVCSHKAWEVDPCSVLKLDWNEATISPSPKVFEAIELEAKQGRFSWYPNLDNEELRSHIANYSNVHEEQVEYFGSSDSLHEYIARTFLDADQSITIVGPTYDNFRAVAESTGSEVNFFYLTAEADYTLKASELKTFVEETNSSFIYLCSPNNPTGTVVPLEDIEYLLSNCPDTLLLLDEAYYEFNGVSAAGLIDKYNNLIITRTFSKAFGLASFRVGYCLASPQIISAMNIIRNPKNIPTLSQVAALAALRDFDYTSKYVAEVLKTKAWFGDQLIDLGYTTWQCPGGNYILLNVGSEAQGFVASLEMHNIFIRNYSHVKCMEGFVRITIGTEVQMSRVLDCIKQYNK